MKILFYMEGRDYRYNSLANVLRSLGSQYVVGICDNTISEDDISGFNPDVIFHNKPEVKRFPFQGNFVSININQSISDTSFVLDPYCILSGWDAKLYTEKYKCKSVYIGNPVVFQKSLTKLISEEDLGFKFLCETPISALGYSGTCLSHESCLFYQGAEACLFVEGDLHRYRDIVMVGGSPVGYTGDDDKFIDDVRACVSGKRENTEIRRGVLSEHTDYDRLISIFSKVGLKRVSGSIREAKTRKLNENNDMC